MTTPFPRRIFTAALGAEILMNSGCMSQKAISHALKTSQVLPDPAPVGRPLDEVLANFGAQIVPYYGVATNFRPIVIEIDHMPNDSGIDKELPINIGTYARIAVEKIGRPLQSYMAWPAIMAIPRYVGIPVPPTSTTAPNPLNPLSASSAPSSATARSSKNVATDASTYAAAAVAQNSTPSTPATKARPSPKSKSPLPSNIPTASPSRARWLSTKSRSLAPS